MARMVDPERREARGQVVVTAAVERLAAKAMLATSTAAIGRTREHQDILIRLDTRFLAP